jgi:hypothetical protein
LNDLTKKAVNCRALLIDLNNDKTDEVIVFNPYSNRFFAKKDESWAYIGDIRVDDYGKDVPTEFEDGVLVNGNYKAITPQWNLLQFGDQQWRIENK